MEIINSNYEKGSVSKMPLDLFRGELMRWGKGVAALPPPEF